MVSEIISKTEVITERVNTEKVAGAGDDIRIIEEDGGVKQEDNSFRLVSHLDFWRVFKCDFI